MPLISVILPVFNSGHYLREAIDSILNQTFTDFELIVINDGSSDNSEELILSYTDARIVYIKNPKNLGLITTLNNAVKIAKGKYIARMDGDDISLPNRFELQLKYLGENPSAKMVCSPIIMMTPSGKETEYWPADQHAKTPEQIVETLPWENCIAHPTILIETEVLKKYLFSPAQKGSEDWDLWLRLARDKVTIIKTKEVLLKYRVIPTSITQVFNAGMSSQIKATRVKLKFTWSSIKQLRLNLFVLKTFFTIYKEIGYHLKTQVLPKRLRQIKWLFTINPFKAYNQYKQLAAALEGNNSRYFLFFPYYHIGGAEKVHAQITQTIEDQKPFVFFTGLDNLSDHKNLFGTKALLLPVAQALYHPLFSSKSERLILQKINNSGSPEILKRPVPNSFREVQNDVDTNKAYVFGSNNYFFYDLVSKLNGNVHVSDLTHDYDYVNGKAFAQKYLKSFLRFNTRVFISNKTVERAQQFYDDNFVDEEYKKHIQLIYNYSRKPVVPVEKHWFKPYKILYVGRDTIEKRVSVIYKLAALCLQAKLPFEFTLVGEIHKQPTADQTNISLKGLVLDPEKLSRFYSEAHFIMISSVSEGFPLSISEGMVHGCIPLSTAVGDIPFHVRNGENGFLVHATEEEQVVKEFFKLLKTILVKESDLPRISQNALMYAELFDERTFEKEYRKLFGLA